MALYFVPASRVRAQTAPQDYFSAAITAGPLTGFDGDWVNPVPGASTGQIAATVAAFTYPYTSLYFDPEVGYNYCCGYFSGSGVATATANRPLVELHAKAGATALGDVEPGFGAVAHAVIGDTLYFSNVAEAETTGTFTIHIDGELTSFAGQGTASGQPYALLYVSVGDAAFSGLYPDQGGFSTADITPNVSGTTISHTWDLVNNPSGHMLVDETIQASFSFTGPDATVPVFFQLSVGGAYGLADFSHTASVSLDLPDGVSFTSASGDFLTGAVPEPSTWVMLALGFFGLGWKVKTSHEARE